MKHRSPVWMIGILLCSLGCGSERKDADALLNSRVDEIDLATTGNQSEPAANRTDPQDPQAKRPLPAAVGPRARLRLSGHLEGRLEPCGCASAQLGGLARRSFLLRRDTNYDLLLEGGNLTLTGNALDELKLITLLSVLGGDPTYAALGIGAGDLAMNLEMASQLFAGFGIPIVTSDLVSNPAADAEINDPWPGLPFFERQLESETSQGVSVRVASLVMATPTGAGHERYGFELLDPQNAWQRAMTDAPPETLRVLMVHGTSQNARDCATLQPKPDLIVEVNGAHPEPPIQAEVVNQVPIVHPGTRGRFLLDVTISRSQGEPRLSHYAPIRLEGSKTAKGAMEDADTRQMVLSHRSEVKEAGIREILAGQLATANGQDFVGSNRCMPCHLEAYKSWQESKHAHAWDTLAKAEVDKYGWPVTHYPDCVGCHTVGYGEETGFINPKLTASLSGVGCEECHGAGGGHVLNPAGNKLGPVDVDTCRQCHDYEQSPDFDYNERWKLIEHGK